jgi:hypothetical protein
VGWGVAVDAAMAVNSDVPHDSSRERGGTEDRSMLPQL